MITIIINKKFNRRPDDELQFSRSAVLNLSTSTKHRQGNMHNAKIMPNINNIKCHAKHHNVGNCLQNKNKFKYLNEIIKCDASHMDLWGLMGNLISDSNVLIFYCICQLHVLSCSLQIFTVNYLIILFLLPKLQVTFYSKITCSGKSFFIVFFYFFHLL